MVVEVSQAPILEIAHVLFIDIVAYSTLPVDKQRRAVRNLQNAITGTTDYGRLCQDDQLIVLPTGDGAALAFFRDVEAPVRCALELATRLQVESQVAVRMGIHSGPVYRMADINANRNVAGGGINMAQRVMDVGDAGHIMVSKTVADMLAEVSTWGERLHDLGVAEVKHGSHVHLFNLYTDTVGNPSVPTRFSSSANRASGKSSPDRLTSGGSTRSPALQPGLEISYYRIIRRIGGGGMGVVYEAEDPRLERRVALKFLPERLVEDPQAIERFRREARAASALNHPHICTVYDVGVHDGLNYIAMELLEGSTLKAVISQHSATIKQTVQWGIQIVDALESAHARGIIHRDLKPSNIFITLRGDVKILDFGLAKVMDAPIRAMANGELDLTQPGVPLGTIAYMSPEQARGEVVDARSDLFSLGVVLYELVTGKQPFSGETPAVISDGILNRDPPEIAELNPSAPGLLQDIVARALQKRPEDRFQSAGEMRAALDTLNLLMGSNPGKLDLAKRQRRRRTPPSPRTIATLALGMLLVVSAAYVAGRYTSPNRAALPLAFQRLTFRSGAILPARFAPDSRAIVYSASLDANPPQIYTTTEESPESRSLQLDNAVLFSVSRRGELAVGLNCKSIVLEAFFEACVATLARIPSGGGAPREIMRDVEAADWLPNGQELAVVHVAEGRRRLEFPIGNPVYETTGWMSSLRVSPEGDVVAFDDHPMVGTSMGRIAVIDRHGALRALTQYGLSLKGMAWAPSGKELWFGGTKGDDPWAQVLRAVDLSGHERILLQLPGITRLQDVSRDGQVLLSKENWRIGLNFKSGTGTTERDLSWFDQTVVSDMKPDGSAILFSEGGQAAKTVSTYLRRTDGSGPVRLGEGFHAALSPDGNWVAVASWEGNKVILVPTGPGTTRSLEPAGIKTLLAPGWSSDSKRVVFAGRDGSSWRFYLQDIDGGPPRVVTPVVSQPSILATQPLSPDGKLIWGTDLNRRAVVLPVDGSAARPVPGITSEDRWANWAADSKSVYIYRPHDSPLRVFRLDLATGARKQIMEFQAVDPVGFEGAIAVRITPDGKYGGCSYAHVLGELYLARGLQ